jgi:hypothetical protein
VTLKRVVKYVDCEYCTAATMRYCVICGGNGWVELVVWRNDEEEPEPGTPEGRGQARGTEVAPDQEERQ